MYQLSAEIQSEGLYQLTALF